MCLNAHVSLDGRLSFPKGGIIMLGSVMVRLDKYCMCVPKSILVSIRGLGVERKTRGFLNFLSCPYL